MSEGQGTAGSGARTHSERSYPDIDVFCDWVRAGMHRVADSVTPPEAASGHFREARIEMLRGVRALIDHRIDRLSRRKDRGATVVVE